MSNWDKKRTGRPVGRREFMAGVAVATAAAGSTKTAAAPIATPPGGRPILFTHVGVLVGDRVRDDAALAVIGGRIAAIGETDALVRAYPGADTYDGRDKVILPGLVNCHAHMAAVIARGFNEDFGFPNSSGLRQMPDGLLSPDERRVMVRVAALEAIRTGTTTLVENVSGIAPHAQALADSGLRMVFAESVRDTENVTGAMSPPALVASSAPIFSAARREEGMGRIEALFSKWHGWDEGRISVIPAAALAETSSPELLKAVRAFAEKHDLSYTIHLSQSMAELEFMRRYHGMSPPAFLDKAGFLGPRLFAAHCRYLDDADIALLGRTRSFVSHQANMAANRGVIPPIPQLRDAGARIAYGTDNNTNDVFLMMRVALLTERIRRNDAFPGVLPQPEQILEDATLGGAAALGMSDATGSIAVGKKADLIVIDMRKPWLTPSGRFVSAWIHGGQSSDIVSSMVDGRFIMRDGKVLTMDEPALLAEASAIGKRVWDKVREAGPVHIPGRPNA